MTATIQIVLFLLAVLVLVAVVAQRLKTPPSILLVVAGIALALVPGLPSVELAPELVLLVLLPPLIYSAGVSMSWREFRFNLRPIALLAFGCVVFTACAIAAAIHYLLGWEWAQNPRVEITLSLMTPYLAYWIPEHLGGSGVLATVAAGLYVSWNGPRLIPAATRLQGIFFWDLIIYLIEGFVFLITGLQARTLIEKAHDFPVRELLAATAITVVIIIVARFIWVFPAIY